MSKKIRINIYDLAMFLNDHAKMALRGDYNNPLLAEFIEQYNEKLQEVSFYGYDDVNNAWYEPNMSVSIKAIRLMFNLSNTTNIVLLDIAIFTPGRMDKVLESYKIKPPDNSDGNIFLIHLSNKADTNSFVSSNILEFNIR